MNRWLAAALMAAIVVYAAGCASAVKMPVDDAAALNALGTSEIPKFAAHYKELYEQQRPPTAEEYGYWMAKYELLQQIYLWAKGKIKFSEIDSDLLKRLLGGLDKDVLAAVLGAVL